MIHNSTGAIPASCPMCSAELTVERSWLHAIIWPGFAMNLVTCTSDRCMMKAEIMRRHAAEIPRGPRPDGFDQREIDVIKAAMVSSGRTPRAAGRTLGASSGPASPPTRRA